MLTLVSWKSKGVRLLGAIAVVASPAAAQLEVFADDVEVRVVNVDVVVTDREDRPVSGLSRDDFQLLVDGEPMEIRHFSAGSFAPAASEEPAAPVEPGALRPPESRSRSAREENLNLIVYIDRSHLGPGDLQDLTVALRSFLGDGLGPGDRVMLASADRRLQVLQELTGSTAELDSVLAGALAGTGRGLRIESEFRDILGAIDKTLEQGNDLPSRLPGHHTQALLSRINAFSEEAYRDVAASHDQLKQMIATVAGLPGRTVVLYVGGRLPIQAGQTLFSAWRNAFGRESARWQSRNPDALGFGGSAAPGTPTDMLADGFRFDALSVPDSNLDAAELFERLAQYAGAFGVRFYTLDATAQRTSAATALSRGSRALAGNSGGSQFGYRETQRGAFESALAVLAEGSGGRSLGESRNFAELFDSMRRDLEAIYSLGFVPPEEDESRVHQIEVKVRAPAAPPGGKTAVKKPRLRYRRQYQSLTLDQLAAEQTLSALLVGATDNPLGVEVSTLAGRDADGGGRLIPISIKVPLALLALVAEGRSHVGKLTVFVTSGDLASGAGPVRRAVVPVRIANEDILNVLGRQLEYTMDVEVAHGARRIAVGVRDDIAPLLSTVMLPVAAPQASSPEAASDRP